MLAYWPSFRKLVVRKYCSFCSNLKGYFLKAICVVTRMNDVLRIYCIFFSAYLTEDSESKKKKRNSHNTEQTIRLLAFLALVICLALYCHCLHPHLYFKTLVSPISLMISTAVC